MKPLRPGTVNAVFLAAAALAVAAVVGALVAIWLLVRDSRLEERAVAVLAQADVVDSAINGAAARQRYFLLGGDESLSADFAKRKADAERELVELEWLSVDARQKERARELAGAAAAQFALLERSIALRRSGEVRSARQLALEPQIAAAAAATQRLIAEFVEGEQGVLRVRKERTGNATRVTVALVGAAAALAIGLFAAAALLLGRYQRERDRALADLTATEQRLELALAGADLAAWDWDVASDAVYLNEGWPRIVGGPPGPVATTSAALAALVHPDDAAGVRAALAALVKGEHDRYDVEHRVRTGGGEYRWIESRGRVVRRAADGRALRVTGTNADITALRRAEDALAARELQLRALVDNVPVMMVDLDANDRFRYCNRQYAAFFGREVEALIGRPLAEVIGEEGYAQFTAAAARSRAGDRVSYEREVERREGGRTVLRIDIVPQTRADASYGGCYALLHDVTEQKRLERLKDQFVSTVSHELRTPLTSIRASLGLLASGRAGEIPADAAMLVAVAHRSTERLARLVNDILDFERMRAGRMQFDLRAHGAAELARQAVAAMQGFADQRGVPIELVLDGAPLVLRTDADRLQQVLVNLIANALKHSPGGSPVEVTLARHDAMAKFSVRDRGPGVPQDFQTRMFEAFAQAVPGPETPGGGTGLGLAIAKGLVELLGGRIGYEPREGGGAHFWFELPLAQTA